MQPCIFCTCGPCPLRTFLLRLVCSGTVSSQGHSLVSITHTSHFLFPISIPILSLILLSPPFGCLFDGSEAAHIYQGAKPNYTAARITPLIQKGVKPSRSKGLNHHIVLYRAGYHVFIHHPLDHKGSRRRR